VAQPVIAANAAKASAEAGEFVLTRIFDASRADVWDAFTRPEHLKHWWGVPGCSLDIVSHELKPGGLFHYCMKFPDGRAMWARFIFREIVAPQRLAWLNGFSDEHGGLTPNPWAPTRPLETLNTATLTEEDGKTLLTFTVVPFNASREGVSIFAAGINGMKAGIGGAFELLAKYLAQLN
jgi:uncharacterized protein YndB with AHSA1/START domain